METFYVLTRFLSDFRLKVKNEVKQAEMKWYENNHDSGDRRVQSKYIYFIINKCSWLVWIL